jgi:hypothetical protein
MSNSSRITTVTKSSRNRRLGRRPNNNNRNISNPAKDKLSISLTTAPNFIKPMPDNMVYSFVQYIPDVLYTQTYPALYNTALNYQLASLDQVNTYTALFDQYRIDEVQVTLRPTFNVGIQGLGTPSPIIYTVIDYDDSSALGTIAAFRQYNNCTETQFETVVRSFKPHAAMAAYTGTFVGFANEESPWLDCSSTTIQHYGYKFAIAPPPSSTTSLYSVALTTRMKISFRNVR